MFFKYIQVGILNSILGLVVILLCLNIFNINYNQSYFVGYFIGFINSFTLNKYYTFKSKTKWQKEVLPFFAVFIISYGMSHFALIVLIKKLNLSKNISVILSMIIYTIVGYILNQKIFNGKSNDK